MSRITNTTRPLLAAALLLSLGLVACDRNSGERSAGEKVDGAVATVDTPARDAKAAADKAVADARQTAGAAAQGASADLSDAAITAKVKASLAADSALSSAAVRVETTSGRTTLQGRVADAAARDRVAQLAAAVKGVWSVDNQLELGL